MAVKAWIEHVVPRRKVGGRCSNRPNVLLITEGSTASHYTLYINISVTLSSAGLEYGTKTYVTAINCSKYVAQIMVDSLKCR